MGGDILLLFWGGGGQASIAPPPPPTLLAAIVAAWPQFGLANSWGPIFGGRAARQPNGKPTPPPYCVVQQIAAPPTFTTGIGWFEKRLVRFSAYHAGEAEAEQFALAIGAAFDFSRLAIGEGYVMSFLRTGSILTFEPQIPPGGGPTSASAVVTFLAVVGKNRG